MHVRHLNLPPRPQFPIVLRLSDSLSDKSGTYSSGCDLDAAFTGPRWGFDLWQGRAVSRLVQAGGRA